MSTKVAGIPEEYLRPDWYAYYVASGRLQYQHRLHREEPWPDGSFHPGRPDLQPHPSRQEAQRYRSFLTQVLPLGTTSNGLFGLKAHRQQLTTALRWLRASGDGDRDDEASLLSRWLPDVRFIYLRRSDSIRRAISHYRALASDVWWRTDDTPDIREIPYGPPTEFDIEQVDHLRRKGDEHHRQWMAFFEHANADPLEIAYEELSNNAPSVVGRVLEYLGVRGSITPPSAPRLRKQADQWSDEAVHAYITWRRAHLALPAKLYGTNLDY